MWSAALMTRNVIHVEGSTDPIRDMDTIDLELVMADMEMVDGASTRRRRPPRGDKKFLHEAEVFPGPAGVAQRRQVRPGLSAPGAGG